MSSGFEKTWRVSPRPFRPLLSREPIAYSQPLLGFNSRFVGTRRSSAAVKCMDASAGLPVIDSHLKASRPDGLQERSGRHRRRTGEPQAGFSARTHSHVACCCLRFHLACRKPKSNGLPITKSPEALPDRAAIIRSNDRTTYLAVCSGEQRTEDLFRVALLFSTMPSRRGR